MDRNDFVKNGVSGGTRCRRFIPKREGDGNNHAAHYHVHKNLLFGNSVTSIADEANYRMNTYLYLKANRRVNGVSKNRLNSLLFMGCPTGRKCGLCKHGTGGKSYEKCKSNRRINKRETNTEISQGLIQSQED